MNDLDVLQPAGKDVQVGAETVTIKPIKFGQLPQASRLLLPLSKQITAAFKGTGELTLAETAGLLVELMADGGEDLLTALSFFIGKPREWFDTLENDEGLEILNAVFEVNADFFSRRVLPMFAPAAPAAPPTGAMSSESSSPLATPEPTSTT